VQKKNILEVKFLGEFESIDHKSEDQLGTFGEITVDKKVHATVPLTKNSLIICHCKE
jgi:hypothetical protein